MDKRILIMGGTGVFGKRLAKHLAVRSDIDLIVSSRSAAKAETFAATLGSNTTGISLDHSKNLAERLAAINPFAVIDCSGPFQSADFEVARTILRSGAHLIDLADARDYLASFPSELNALAQVSGVTALTGASSTPTLSTSVVQHVTQDWQRIDTIDICITPGGKSEVGRAVIAAILSYAGKEIPIWQNGQLSRTIGWSGARSVVVPNLGHRRVAPVETFDAEYLGPLHNVQSRVSFAAGLESSIEQRGIEAIAALRKRRLVPNPKKLIPLLLKARQITRIPTSDQGGMLVEVTGLDATGCFTQTRWSLIAKTDHGPTIPILPAAAALEKLLCATPPNGACLAHAHITLPDILAQMAPYDIVTKTDTCQAEQSGFETYLSAGEFSKLPHAVQEFHTQSAPPIWKGKADIKSGRSILAKALARLFGFPQSGQNVPVSMQIDRTISNAGAAVECWTRTFGEKSMSSVLQQQADGSFVERFAPFTFAIALTADETGLTWPVTRWTLGKIPLPFSLAPRSVSREFQDAEGRFRFDVSLSAPIVGQIAHYQGWLEPDHPAKNERLQ